MVVVSLREHVRRKSFNSEVVGTHRIYAWWGRHVSNFFHLASSWAFLRRVCLMRLVVLCWSWAYPSSDFYPLPNFCFITLDSFDNSVSKGLSSPWGTSHLQKLYRYSRVCNSQMYNSKMSHSIPQLSKGITGGFLFPKPSGFFSSQVFLPSHVLYSHYSVLSLLYVFNFHLYIDSFQISI